MRQHHGDILREATRLAASGKIMPQLDPRRFNLDSVGAACALIESRQAAGKLVIDIASGAGWLDTCGKPAILAAALCLAIDIFTK